MAKSYVDKVVVRKSTALRLSNAMDQNRFLLDLLYRILAFVLLRALKCLSIDSFKCEEFSHLNYHLNMQDQITLKDG